MEGAARDAGAIGESAVNGEVAHIVLRTVTDRGKQHNPVTGSGGMLLGRVLQVGAGRSDSLGAGDRIASLVSLSLTPLRVDRVRGGSASERADRRRRRGGPLRERSLRKAAARLARARRARGARRRRCGAAGRAPRRRPAHVVVVLGAGGKSGVLCVAEARRSGGAGACVVGVEPSQAAAEELGRWAYATRSCRSTRATRSPCAGPSSKQRPAERPT